MREAITMYAAEAWSIHVRSRFELLSLREQIRRGARAGGSVTAAWRSPGRSTLRATKANISAVGQRRPSEDDFCTVDIQAELAEEVFQGVHPRAELIAIADHHLEQRLRELLAFLYPPSPVFGFFRTYTWKRRLLR